MNKTELNRIAESLAENEIKIIGGNAWKLIEGVLFTAAVFTDGTIDKDNWSEVDDGFRGPSSDRPESGKVYALTSFKNGGPSIAAGNTWSESEVKMKQKEDFVITHKGKEVSRHKTENEARSAWHKLTYSTSNYTLGKNLNDYKVAKEKESK